MKNIFTNLLAALLMIFLCWNNSDIEIDNWDKLNVIIENHYQQAKEQTNEPLTH